jgi:G protein-coupled receptor Mth (Methuselah protein)
MLLLQFILFGAIYYVNGQQTPCPKVLTIDITDGDRVEYDIIKDNIVFGEGNYFFDNGSTLGCICNIKRPCIRKCCGPNEIMIDKDCVSSNFSMTFPTHNEDIPTNAEQDYHFVHNKDCKNNKMLLTPHFQESDKFYIQANGSIFLPMFDDQKWRNPEDYCVEVFDNEELELNKTLSIMLCLSDEEENSVDSMHKINVYGMIISMPFLLATFIAYALLPDRNLHMKALMFYVINLMLSYLLLVIIQLTDSRFSQGVCTSIGYFCLLFFLVSFFWMNVICIDIWFTFSGLRGFTGSKKSAERKRFFMYSAYAWAVPILHVLIVYIIDTNSKENSWFSPGIGKGQCFLRRGYPELLYFYGPMAILITINIILFAVTAFKIRSIKKETSMLKKEDSKRHSYENDKQTFNLYLKLLFAMGVNWSMEIISWAVIWSGKAPDAIWYLTDFCNAIYGVFIFFIFVFKRSIWKLLKKRYYTFIGKPYLAHSMTMTNTTRVTSYSTANSSVAENPHGVHDTSTLTSEA